MKELSNEGGGKNIRCKENKRIKVGGFYYRVKKLFYRKEFIFLSREFIKKGGAYREIFVEAY